MKKQLATVLKKTLFLLCTFLLLFSFALGSNGLAEEGPPSVSTKFPIPFEENNLWGFVNGQGRVVVPPIWDEVSPFVNGYAKVTKNEKIGYINLRGEMIIPPKWDIGSNFYEGYAKVAQAHILYNRTYKDYREGYFFIDAQGQLLTPTIWGEASVFIDGLALVQKNFVWGFINTKGQVVYPLQWDDIYPLTREILPYPNYQYIDDEEGLGPWEGRSLFLDGLIVIVQNDLCGLLNDKWQIVVPPTWGSIKALSEGLIVVVDKDTFLYGFINTKGEVVLPPVWEEATSFINSLAQVKTGGQWQTINTKGEVVDNLPLVAQQAKP